MPRRLSTILTVTMATLAALGGATPALAADGDLDTTFGGDGKVSGASPSFDGIGRQSTGKLVGVGLDEGVVSLVRLTSGGAVDGTWDGDGRLEIPADGIEKVVAVEVQTDDKVLVFARGAAFTGGGTVLRITAGGAPDVTFDGDGRRDLVMPSRGFVTDGTLDSSGRAVLVGTRDDSKSALLRLTTGGALDRTFGGNGVVEDMTSPIVDALAIAPAAGDRVVVTGNADEGAAVSRFSATGTPDPAFDEDGHRTIPHRAYTADVAVDPLGRTIAAFWIDAAVNVVRLTASGTPDETFAGDGSVALPGFGWFGALAVQSDGRPVVGGSTTRDPETDANDFRVTRLTSGGEPDPAFGAQGTAAVPFDGGWSEVNDLIVAPDRRIVAAGFDFGDHAVARFKGAPADTVRPSVAITAPSTTTGPATFAFSEDVRSVTTLNTALRIAGTTANLAATLVCRDAFGSLASCTTGAVRTATLTPRAPLVPGQSYVSLANAPGTSTTAKDFAGNGLLSASRAFRGDQSVEEDDAAVRQAWPAEAAAGSAGGTVRRESATGASATFTFTGTQAALYPSRGPDHGRARITVDGGTPTTVDLYSATRRYDLPVSFGPLRSGTHTVHVEVLGTRQAASSGVLVGIDALTAGAAPAQTDPAGAYRWRSGSAGSASGGRFATTALGDGSVRLAFRGPSVSWRTYTAPNQGTVKVLIDGVQHGAVVDNYAPAASWTSRSISGLADAPHTIEIVPTGQKSAGSTGTSIAVDRFTVG